MRAGLSVIDAAQLPAVIHAASTVRGVPRLPESSTTVAPKGISFVIPAYNEEHRLRPTLEAYLTVLERLSLPFEVVVVVSGTDATAAVSNSYHARGVRTVHSATRMGKGKAILNGFRVSRYRIVAYADADGSVPPQDVERLLRMAIDGDRCIFASRRIEPGTVWVREPAPKYFASNIWHALVRLLLDIPLRDAECGFKIITKDLAERIVSDVTVTNWVFDVTMILHLRSYGEVLKEVPVNYRYDHKSHMKLVRTAPVMFVCLIAVFLTNRPRIRRLLPMKFLRIMNQRFGAE